MSSRTGRQWLLVGLALSLWSAYGTASLFALAGSYAVAWLACELPPARRLIREARPATSVLLAVALAAPGIAFGYRARADLAVNEGLLGAATRFRDRWRTQSMPSIAPPVLALDRPQTFFVATQGANKLSLSASGVRPIQGEALGHGLFRIDYDPRRDGVPAEQGSHVAVRLDADGRASERTLDLVRPLAHPRWFCLAPDRSRAIALSEETDELFVLSAGGLERRQATGDGPVDCAFIDATRVAVAHRNEASLRVYDVGRVTGDAGDATPAHAVLSLGARQGRLALSPSGSVLAVALLGDSPSIALVAVPELSLNRRIPVPHAADWIAFGTDDDTLLIATRADAAIHRFHAGIHDAQFELGRPAVTLERSADGAQLWVATTDLHAAGHPQLGNHFVQDQVLTLSTSPLALISRRFTAERSERQSKPGDVDRGLSPMGVHHGRDGTLWLAFAGSDELWCIRPGTSTPRQLDLGEFELYTPHGVAVLADGSVLVSSPVSGAFGIFAPGASTPRVIRVSPSARSSSRVTATDSRCASESAASTKARAAASAARVATCTRTAMTLRTTWETTGCFRHSRFEASPGPRRICATEAIRASAIWTRSHRRSTAVTCATKLRAAKRSKRSSARYLAPTIRASRMSATALPSDVDSTRSSQRSAMRATSLPRSRTSRSYRYGFCSLSKRNGSRKRKLSTLRRFSRSLRVRPT